MKTTIPMLLPETNQTGAPLPPSPTSTSAAMKRRAKRLSPAVAALAALILGTAEGIAADEVPFKGNGVMLPVPAEAVPADLVLDPADYPEPVSPDHFVLQFFYDGECRNTQLGRYRIFMTVFLHIPWNPAGNGLWVSHGAGIYVAANGDELQFHWPSDVVNPATSEPTVGTAVITGRSGRFAGARGLVDWVSWEDPETGVRSFDQEGWITRVGGRQRP